MKHISRFIEEHHFRDDIDLCEIAIAIDALYDVQKIATQYIDKKKYISPKSEFLSVTFQNIISRIFEQADGMLVCIATHNYTGSEALARIVIESSVNLMYMSLYGLEIPVIGFFESWLNEHKKKLNKWKENLPEDSEKEYVSELIEQRLSVLNFHSDYVEGAIEHFHLEQKPLTDAWPPNLIDRFKAVERLIDYYTSYHRLSNSSHMSAEDTISFLIAYSTMDEDKMLEMGLEAIAFSIMMTRIAMTFYIDGVAYFLIKHDIKEPIEQIKEHKEKLMAATHEIAKAAGCPI